MKSDGGMRNADCGLIRRPAPAAPRASRPSRRSEVRDQSAIRNPQPAIRIP
jgi:hypothetical protein